MKFLVVMPRFVRDVGDGYIFPLGIPYISSSLKNAGFSVSTLNLNHNYGSIREVLEKKIITDNIDVVFTGGLSAQYHAIKNIVDSIKQINSKILIVVGGGIISADPEVAMDALENVDYGVIGEGEVTSIELCQALENNLNLLGIDGLIFRDKISEKYIITNRRKEISDLDILPWPDYYGFDYDKNLISASGLFSFGNKKMAYVISSRSCPYNCTFCFHTSGKKYRQRSIEKFFKEIEYLISEYQIDEICIADELFARDIDRLRFFCKKIKEYNVTWNASFRVSDVTSEMIDLIRDTNNCSWMGFGIESADNRILKSMRKNITIEQTERVLNACYNSGIPVQGNFIFGDIAETLETAENSLDWLKRNQGKFNLKVAHIVAYPGTYIYKYACENKLIPNKIKFLKDGCPQINISQMSDEEYSILSSKIADIVSDPTQGISALEIFNIDDNNGFISVRGCCEKCNFINVWDNVRLFKYSFMVCKNCGQKYPPPLTNKFLISNIESNILSILKIENKIGIWGMSDHMVTIFRNSILLNNDNIFPIDISVTKQGKSLFGKMVYSPDIIAKEEIEIVIIAAVMHIGIIESQIKSQYPNVKKIYDISNLIGASFLKHV